MLEILKEAVSMAADVVSEGVRGRFSEQRFSEVGVSAYLDVMYGGVPKSILAAAQLWKPEDKRTLLYQLILARSRYIDNRSVVTEGSGN